MPTIDITYEQMELLRNLVQEEYQFLEDEVGNRKPALDDLTKVLSGETKFKVTVVEDWNRYHDLEVWAETEASAISLARGRVKKTPGLDELGMNFAGFDVVEIERL